jgi:toxin ParE1/3/4
VRRELVIRSEAEADIAEAADWYNRQRPRLGTDFVLAVNAALQAVQRNPFRQFRRAGVAPFPYGLIYRASERDIIVVACFHGRRNPNVWKKRT